VILPVPCEHAVGERDLHDALRSLVEFLAIDRSNLFQWSTDGRNLQNTHQWVVEGCEPLPPIFVQEALPFFLPKLLQGEPYGYASLDELPPEAATERVFLEKHGPKSKLCLPLVVGGTVVGALGLGVLRHECEWPDALKERLAVVAHVFANALERKRSDLALQQAYTELTQLKERLELENQFLRQQLKMVRKTSRASRRAPR
jgi:formate hydrogenlyase transcriptional activator